ncbi:hypothetical protein [Proteus mirabilis]|nr:hypothetical protein [Proteus mirabilis]
MRSSSVVRGVIMRKKGGGDYAWIKSKTNSVFHNFAKQQHKKTGALAGY